VTSAKAEVAEFKPESFKIPERFNTRVDMRLFFETVVVAFGFKHHSHPIVSCVNRWLFMATAHYTYHIIFCSCRTFRGQANACRVRQKRDMLCLEKKEMRFFIRGSYADASDHAVFPIAVNENIELKKISLLIINSLFIRR
jgi:hypothetical protein